MKKAEHRILSFMRRNAIYLVLALCIIAVGVAVTFMLINKQDEFSADNGNDKPVINQPIEPDEPSDGVGDVTEPEGPVVNPDDTPTDTEPVIKPIEFIMPVESISSIGAYSETMVWSSTLGRYSTHMAIDFFADEGTAVVAVYDGTVKSIENTLLKGTTIVIDHGNGLETVYNSLADGDSVSVGQTVSKGDIIGEVSVSNRQESKSGAHLHFEVVENGQTIDPVKYLVIDEK